MRKFRFIGNEQSIYWGHFEPNKVYDGDYKVPQWRPIDELAEIVPEDWEEIKEPEWTFEPSNQDKPASSMTKFEMGVFMVIGHFYSNNSFDDAGYDEISEIAIQQVRETFKQLDELKK